MRGRRRAINPGNQDTAKEKQRNPAPLSPQPQSPNQPRRQKPVIKPLITRQSLSLRGKFRRGAKHRPRARRFP